jgi:hypothetical protein
MHSQLEKLLQEAQEEHAEREALIGGKLERTQQAYT